jgi:hypothetical protein
MPRLLGNQVEDDEAQITVLERATRRATLAAVPAAPPTAEAEPADEAALVLQYEPILRLTSATTAMTALTPAVVDLIGHVYLDSNSYNGI